MDDAGSHCICATVTPWWWQIRRSGNPGVPRPSARPGATIIGEMLGVPVADRQQFRRLVRDLVALFEMQPTELRRICATN